MSKLCILDPASHVPGLKRLFPEADVFSYESDKPFRWHAFNYPPRDEIQKEYGYLYRTDWESITSETFDTLFIVAPLLNYFESGDYKLVDIDFMKEKIKDIVVNSKIKTVVVFDIFDYDYDPSTIGCDWGVTYYFKRNYNKSKVYNSNVFPFPFICHMKHCALELALNTHPSFLQDKENSVFWCGSLFNHIDERFQNNRNREAIYSGIQHLLYSYTSIVPTEFIQTIKKHRFAVDLIGVGSPNKRTFEVLYAGSLLLAMHKELEWGFDDGDSFAEETLFSTPEEFEQKLAKLLHDKALYEKCKFTQNYIIKKYFNTKWMRSYILKKIHLSLES